MKALLYLSIAFLSTVFFIPTIIHAQEVSGSFNQFPDGTIELLSTNPNDHPRTGTTGSVDGFFAHLGQYPTDYGASCGTFGGHGAFNSETYDEAYANAYSGRATTTNGIITISPTIFDSCGSTTTEAYYWLEERVSPYRVYYNFHREADGTWDSQVSQDFSFTRFYDLNLSNGTTTSTSSPLYFTGSINLNKKEAPDVFTSDYDIEISVKRNEDDQLVGACAAIGACAPVFSIKAPLLNEGINVFATSTDFIPTRGGEYTVEWKLVKKDWASSLLSFFALDTLFNTGVVTSTTTTFIAGELTGYDVAIHTIGGAIDAGYASSTASSTLAKLDHCNPLSGFDTALCLAGLFTFDPSQGQYLIDKARSDIFDKAPFGYILRMRDIMATTSTTSLPVLGFTIKSGEPLAGVYSIDMNSVLDQADGLVRNTFTSDKGMVDVPEGKNVWDILMPLVQLVTYLGLFIYIIHDILGMQEFHQPRGRRTLSETQR